MADSAAALKRKILDGFAATPYPGDDNLLVDQTGCDRECSEVADAFRGKHWNEISRETLRKFAQALPLFTPSAFRYYLPAYMMGSISPYNEGDVGKDFVVFNLTPPNEESGWEADFFHARAKQFNAGERDGIASFLELTEEHNTADWAGEGLEPPPGRIRFAIDFWRSKQ